MVKHLFHWSAGSNKVLIDGVLGQSALHTATGFFMLLLMTIISGCGGSGGNGGGAWDDFVGDPVSREVELENVSVTHNSNNILWSKKNSAGSFITPAQHSISIGAPQQFKAIATFSDGSSSDVTSKATWSSSSPSIASINNASGYATGVTSGTTEITASFGFTGANFKNRKATVSKSGSASLLVTTATLSSISVTPVAGSLPNGFKQQFVATGTFSDGTTADISGSATWSSSNTTIATIASTGIATGVSIGVTTITATSGSKSGSASLTVASTELISIFVRPIHVVVVPIGFNQSFIATGTFSDGTSVDITKSVTWSSSDTAIATIVSPGVVKGVLYGTPTITATYGDKSSSATMTVYPAYLTSIVVVRPIMASAPSGYTQQFIAVGCFSNFVSFDISDSVIWKSNNTAAVIVESPGMAISSTDGNFIITATYDNFSGSAPMVVTGASLSAIAVSPLTSSIAINGTQSFVATGTYSDGTSLDVTDLVNWSSGNSTVATIASTGIASGVKAGSTTIRASAGAMSASVNLTVTGATLNSIAVTPLTASIVSGLTQAFVATGSYSDGTSVNISSTVTWSSSNTLFATVLSSGIASGVSAGSATISAALSGRTGSATLTVTSATLTSISLAPLTASVPVGSLQALIATGTFSDGTTADISNTVIWSSGTTSAATVLQTGVTTGIAIGSSIITATSGTKSATATITVTPATLSSIAVTPLTATVPSTFTQAFIATGTYSDGTILVITNAVTWSSGTIAVATVLPTGVATGVSAGTATITATSGAKTGTGTLTVSSVTLASIAVTPAVPTIALGGTQAFTANGTFSDASVVDITNTATWTSSNLPIATVLATGIATGVSAGTSTITATSGLVSNTSTLTVTAAALVSIAVTPTATAIANGGSQAYVAMGTYSDASIVNITNSVIWSSNNLPVATILASGVASGPSAGTARITATSGLITNFATLTVNAALGPARVDLATAGNFVILTKTGITNAVAATLLITGDIGSSPITGAAMNTIPCAKVVGSVYEVDAGYTGGACGKSTAGDKTIVDNAVLDMGIAFADAKGRTLPNQTELGAGNISGMTLVPGLYKWGTGVLITNVGLTLSGGPNDIWIFQVGVDLTINSGAIITLTGGALPKNIFWQIDGQTTLGTTVDFKGIVLCQTLISVDTSAVVNGRLLAQTEVTLQGNAITQPAP